MDLISQVEAILAQEKILRKRDRIFIACSGGPDSVALFHVFLALKDRWKFRLGLLHFNHRLRGAASEGDGRFVRSLARKYRVPFYAARGAVLGRAKRNRESLEESARHERYRFFRTISKRHKIPKIVLGHNKDDQAETVLMRVLQGTGVRGLAGIRKSLRSGSVTFYRPLLQIPKSAILGFLNQNKIAYRLDSSNRSTNFLRNKIRLKLLPDLARHYNPRVSDALGRLAAIAAEEAEMGMAWEKKAWKEMLPRLGKKRIRLTRTALRRYPGPLQFRLLDRALKALDPKSGIDFETWQRMLPHLKKAPFRCTLPRNIECRIGRREILLSKNQPVR